jgi:DNA-binding MarR family transcriptional regulator
MKTKSTPSNKSLTKPPYTHRQGQVLAFIYYYTKIHKCPPAEGDIAAYLGVSPPSVHGMVVTLEKHGLITRVPGRPRSIRVLLPHAELPDLD